MEMSPCGSCQSTAVSFWGNILFSPFGKTSTGICPQASSCCGLPFQEKYSCHDKNQDYRRCISQASHQTQVPAAGFHFLQTFCDSRTEFLPQCPHLPFYLLVIRHCLTKRRRMRQQHFHFLPFSIGKFAVHPSDQ